MPVNQRQFDQLTEMGISLWQHKVLCFDDNPSPQNKNKQKERYISQDNLSLADLAKQTIFTDILQSFGVSIGEITVNQDHLDLGLFNWYFSTKAHNESAIYYSHNNLFSPDIRLISQSSELKKQLWIIVAKHLL